MWKCNKCKGSDVTVLPVKESGKTRPSIIAQGNRIKTEVEFICSSRIQEEGEGGNVCGNSWKISIWGKIATSGTDPFIWGKE